MVHTVNTEGIADAISRLRTANDNINNSFDSLKKKSSQLERSWNSAAGSVAVTIMYELFKGGETRSSVIQNYINLLEQQVNPGYFEAEKTNKTLADMFK